MQTVSCGCTVDTHFESGVTRSLRKCSFHVRELMNQPQGEAYYRSIGVLDVKGEVRCDHYAAELLDAIGEIPKPPTQFATRYVPEALEVGCGLSPYVPAIKAAGYQYTGIDPDQWAAAETAKRYGVEVLCDMFSPTRFPPDCFGMILAAHSLEHMPDAPQALLAMSHMLVPGGHLVIVVPDDTDLANPDHLWFFNAETLYATLNRLGLLVVTITERQHIEREKFIYCVARKPETTWPAKS